MDKIPNRTRAMKRFNKSVEDMLLGKYGIKWCPKVKVYYQYYKTCANGQMY